MRKINIRLLNDLAYLQYQFNLICSTWIALCRSMLISGQFYKYQHVNSRKLAINIYESTLYTLLISVRSFTFARPALVRIFQFFQIFCKFTEWLDFASKLFHMPIIAEVYGISKGNFLAYKLEHFMLFLSACIHMYTCAYVHTYMTFYILYCAFSI